MGLVVYFFASRDTEPLSFKNNKSSQLIKEFQKSKEHLSPLATNKYSYGLSSIATNQGKPIDWSNENKEVSQFLQYLQKSGKKIHFIVVPGFVPPTDEPIQLHRFNKVRLNMAVKEMNRKKTAVVLLSGGNVKPAGTPYNESIEMKKRLMKVHGVPEFRIVIDPNAQNTVTNFRNAGRFMLAHDINEAQVVTTFIQNFYISFPVMTFFETRSQDLLGYEVGSFSMTSLGTSQFKPSQSVFEKGSDPKDP